MTVITTTDSVTALMMDALKTPSGDPPVYPTAAGDRVYNPRSWPLRKGDLPAILVQSPIEHKESLGPNAPQYNVSPTIRIIGRLTFKAVPDDAAAAAALEALGALQRQIEIAIVNNYALYRVISEIKTIDAKSDVKSDGNQSIAELEMDFVPVFYQGPECFAPMVTTAINELAVYGDLLNVFDPSGEYQPPFDYDPTVDPRTTGPDGRVEIGAVIAVPQD